jgi:hypothetical protein
MLMSSFSFVLLILAASINRLVYAAKPYRFVLATVFKNEAALLPTWLQHYINEGVEHFYLIDNGSTDNYMHIIQKIPPEMITLVRDDSTNVVGLQEQLLAKYYTDIIREEADWVMVADIDEYLYPLNSSQCIVNVLDSVPLSVYKLILPWKVFGSNKYIDQPANIIESFTRRRVVNVTNAKIGGYSKGLVRVTDSLQLKVHMSTVNESSVSYFSDSATPFQSVPLLTESFATQLPLQLNHYMFMSKNYYQNVKCVRGGAQTVHSRKYTMDYYKHQEKTANAVVDTMLSKRQAVRKGKCLSKQFLASKHKKSDTA